MFMQWSQILEDHLHSRFGESPDRNLICEKYSWVSDIHAKARKILSPDRLSSQPPQEIYHSLAGLALPGVPFRLTRIGKANDAARIGEAVVKLLTEPGNFEQKYRAAKIPQTGVVTLTEILCLAKPGRFALRNTAFTRSLARVIPLYTAQALKELSYEDYLDYCRELARIQERYLAGAGLEDWAREHRFLLLYAILACKQGG
jgi:hypothetical protein